MREMHEETGLDVEVCRLLYVCDHPAADVPHITFISALTAGHGSQILIADGNCPLLHRRRRRPPVAGPGGCHHG